MTSVRYELLGEALWSTEWRAHIPDCGGREDGQRRPRQEPRHLVELRRDSRDEFITFDFARRNGESPVFVRKEMLAATDEILTDNGIRSQGSPDAMAVWKAQAGAVEVPPAAAPPGAPLAMLRAGRAGRVPTGAPAAPAKSFPG